MAVAASSLRIAIGSLRVSLTSRTGTTRFSRHTQTTTVPCRSQLQQLSLNIASARTFRSATIPSQVRFKSTSSSSCTSKATTTINRKAELASPASSPKPIMNGATTAASLKRKGPPEALGGRHTKHQRGLGGKESAGDNTPDVDDELENGLDFDSDDARLPALLSTGPDTAEWQATIENVVRNVVSIRFCQTASFDTDPALTSEATGFVVDAERG